MVPSGVVPDAAIHKTGRVGGVTGGVGVSVPVAVSAPVMVVPVTGGGMGEDRGDVRGVTSVGQGGGGGEVAGIKGVKRAAESQEYADSTSYLGIILSHLFPQFLSLFISSLPPLFSNFKFQYQQ